MYYVEMWVDFIVEFGLDLVEIDWQLFVVGQFLVGEIGCGFFGGGVVVEYLFFVVFDFEQLWVEFFLLVGGFLQFFGLDGWDLEFDGVGMVYFFVYDVFDFVQYVQVQWRLGVQF